MRVLRDIKILICCWLCEKEFTM